MKGSVYARRIMEKLQKGIALHNAGGLIEAEKIYRSALRKSPRHPDALHLMALICYARQQYVDAVRYSELAIAANPAVANFHNTAGEARRMLGDMARSVAHFEQAIKLDSGLALAHHNVSLCYFALNRLPEARRECEAALLLRPEYPEALAHGLDMALLADNEAESLGIADSLRRIEGEEARRTLARFHLERAKRRVADLDWDGVELEARAAMDLVPDHWGSYAQLAIASHQKGKLDAAEQLYRQVLGLVPAQQEATLNLAHFLVEQRRLDEAERLYCQVLLQDASEPSALFGLAGIYLFRGEYEKGWPYYEARWEIPTAGGARWGVARQWDGRPVPSLLLYCEQGYGDTIQMLRFLPEVVQRAQGAVTLHVPDALVRLVSRIPERDDIRIVHGQNIETGFAAECPLMSLPGLLGIHSPDAAGVPAPYLAYDDQRAKVFDERLIRYPGHKLGIVWQGGAQGRINLRRALPPEVLEPLFKLSGWIPVSLQFGVKSPTIAGVPLVDLSAMIHDFDDLAAAIMAVDAVVSLDSAPAHLAAALGRETFVLIPSLHDWRWGLEGDSTPWYPSMTLVRQELSQDWSKPVRRMAALLEEKAGQLGIAALNGTAPKQSAVENHQPADEGWRGFLRRRR